jgi:hypothetical protein
MRNEELKMKNEKGKAKYRILNIECSMSKERRKEMRNEELKMKNEK